MHYTYTISIHPKSIQYKVKYRYSTNITITVIINRCDNEMYYEKSIFVVYLLKVI